MSAFMVTRTGDIAWRDLLGALAFNAGWSQSCLEAGDAGLRQEMLVDEQMFVYSLAESEFFDEWVLDGGGRALVAL